MHAHTHGHTSYTHDSNGDNDNTNTNMIKCCVHDVHINNAHNMFAITCHDVITSPGTAHAYMMTHFGTDGDKDYHYDTPPSRRTTRDVVCRD